MQENVHLEIRENVRELRWRKPLGEQGNAKKLCTILVACFPVDTGM